MPVDLHGQYDLSNTKDDAVKLFSLALIYFGLTLVILACASVRAEITKTPGPQSTAIAAASDIPDWFNIELTDAMMIALGGMIALLAIPASRVLLYRILHADFLILLLGILLLLYRKPFKALPLGYPG
jgi:hypothetical protein